MIIVRASNVNAIRPPNDPTNTYDPNNTIENVKNRIDDWHEYIYIQRGEQVLPVGFFLQHWGLDRDGPVESLMQNEADKVTGPPGAAAQIGTIYSKEGRAKAAQYTDDLIDELISGFGAQPWQLEYLFWDLEEGFNIFQSFQGEEPNGNPKGWVYHSRLDATRYDVDAVLEEVLDDGTVVGKTFKNLWEDEAGPRYGADTSEGNFDDSRLWRHPENFEVVRFLYSLLYETLDWALDETLYRKFRAQWGTPDKPVICGNYRVAVYDREWPNLRTTGSFPFMTRFVVNTFYSDCSMPVLYPTGQFEKNSDYDPNDPSKGPALINVFGVWGKADWSNQEFMRWRAVEDMRRVSIANQRHRKPIQPWIPAPGQFFPNNVDGALVDSYTPTYSDYLFMLELSYRQGARLFALFMSSIAGTTSVYSNIPPDEFGRSGWDRILAGLDWLKARTTTPAGRQRGRRDRARV